MEFLKRQYGTILCLAVATVAWFLGRALPLVGGAVFGILFGMALAPILSKRESFASGIKLVSKKGLQAAVILLGFEMQFSRILAVGSQSLVLIVFTLSGTLLAAFFAGKALKLPGDVATLIGVGTAICGGSAIAATAPVIGAKDSDVAHSVSTIFLFNLLAVWIFPPLGRLLGLGDHGFGMWAGTAVNDTSSVVAAAGAWSAAAGNDTALSFATIVKLTRTLFIIPIVLALSWYTTRRKGRAEASGQVGFAKVFPWFILGFLAAALANSFLGIPAELSGFLVGTGKFLIIAAMVAIGLSTSIKALVANGWKPIALGLSCWVVVATISLAVQKVMGFW